MNNSYTTTKSPRKRDERLRKQAALAHARRLADENEERFDRLFADRRQRYDTMMTSVSPYNPYTGD